jgi:hypothetical protein
MTFEEMNTVPCEICGEDYLPHMLNTNSFVNQLTCETCDSEIAHDMEQEMWNKVDFDVQYGWEK